MNKESLEKKKKELEDKFNQRGQNRQKLLDLANQEWARMLELKGEYKAIDDLTKESENLDKEKKN